MTTIHIEADRTKTWHFCKVLVAFTFLSFGSLTLILSAGRSWTIGAATLLTAIPTAVAALIGLSVGFYWLLGPARVSYECDGIHLNAFRGTKLVKSIPCEAIESFELSGSITWTVVMNFVGLPPSLPRLVADIKDEDRGIRAVGFPEILRWGKESVVEADSALHRVFGNQYRD